jgi:GNAT superfamily N-acetyltransferase
MTNDHNGVTVRAVQPGDFEPWLALWLAYQDFYQVTFDDQVTRTTFQRFLDPGEPLVAAIALQAGQVVGLVHAVVHRSTWATADFCYLEDLYVAPSARGAGAGKALIEWVQAFARQQQCARLYWHTHQTNERAQMLYNRLAENAGSLEYRMAL